MTVERYLMEALKTAPVYVEDVFSTYLYTGNGATQTITNNIDLSTKGGMVWIKGRDFATAHMVFDTARGVEKYISTNLTSAQNYNGSPPSFYTLGSFNNDGFTLSGDGGGAVNTSSRLYCSWTFRKQPKFFDVVTYTGDGTNNRQIAHALAATPGMVIVKCTSNVGGWATYHRSLGATNTVFLNTTAAQVSVSSYWNNTSPTSSVFTVGDAGAVNNTGYTYVAYLFADQAGGFGLSGTDSVVACGSFTGNTTVNLGWEPQLLIVKRTDTTGNWQIIDNMRGMPVIADYTGSQQVLFANTSGSESNTGIASPNSTGFNPVSSVGTYIYLAIRRGPMKVPTSGTSVFAPVASNLAAASINTTNFPVDLQWFRDRVNVANNYIVDRLRGISSNSTASGAYLYTQATNAEGTNPITLSWNNTSFQTPSIFASTSMVYNSFRRAPGFMDEVCYTGTGSATTVAHNLGVVPELMIVKGRNSSFNWAVYAAPLGNTKGLELNNLDPPTTSFGYWNNTSPTSSIFTIGGSNSVNSSSTSTYVAYLFATCPGVSKVGSYTGTGAAQNINCGFSAGARFVLIKRTDSTGDWYVYDSARGISSGNDPYLLLNSTAAEVTGTNYVDTFASGFTLTASAPAGLNANGGSFIFLAIS